MPIEFLYFDLGMVLVTFSVERMCRQMAEVAGITPDRVHEVIFQQGLQRRYEVGAISEHEFYEEFCRAAPLAPIAGRSCVRPAISSS